MGGKKILFFLFFTFAYVLCCTAEDNACKKLMQQGFPEDYAIKLAELQKKYPNWRFEVLNITKLKSEYTWQYVLHQETDASPSRSLISGHKRFSAYFHPEDKKKYDAGCRRASTEAVAYFLDPRNFLNEQDIFQFENITEGTEISLQAVKNALKGTFMENSMLENGKSYAEFFLETGIELNINPIFLASRARQEQGLDGTPLISGKCGTMLLKDVIQKILNNKSSSIPKEVSDFKIKDFLQYDNLYNFFNINAFSDRRFLIHLNGMIEALEGSPEMTAVWGAPKWDKKWKSIYGGALKIKKRYAANYQNTPYLQKWNVDPRCKTANGRSRNFWAQYMQNIGAALSEARNTAKSLKKESLHDIQFTFLIPVYDGMPAEISADPASGNCLYYKSYEHNNQNKNKEKK